MNKVRILHWHDSAYLPPPNLDPTKVYVEKVVGHSYITESPSHQCAEGGVDSTIWEVVHLLQW